VWVVEEGLAKKRSAQYLQYICIGVWCMALLCSCGCLLESRQIALAVFAATHPPSFAPSGTLVWFVVGMRLSASRLQHSSYPQRRRMWREDLLYDESSTPKEEEEEEEEEEKKSCWSLCSRSCCALQL